MATRHLLIAGTGRAGTTALVRLLEACGLETAASSRPYSDAARAGLETKLDDANAPYVIKSPELSEDLRGLLDDGFAAERIDGIILPIRDLDAVVASRIRRFTEGGLHAPGGLWRQRSPSGQRSTLAVAVHDLLLTAAEHDITVLPIAFPRFVNDGPYAWACLRTVLPDLDEAAFLTVHHDVLKPELAHDLTPVGRIELLALDLRWLSDGYTLRRLFRRAAVRAAGSRGKALYRRLHRG